MLPGEPRREEVRARKNKLSPKRETEDALPKCTKKGEGDSKEKVFRLIVTMKCAKPNPAQGSRFLTGGGDPGPLPKGKRVKAQPVNLDTNPQPSGAQIQSQAVVRQ